MSDLIQSAHTEEIVSWLLLPDTQALGFGEPGTNPFPGVKEAGAKRRVIAVERSTG